MPSASNLVTTMKRIHPIPGSAISSSLFLLAIVLVQLLLTGCEKAIDFKGQETESLFVLNSLFADGDSVQVRVSRSVFFLNDEINDAGLKDAKVTVSINGQEAVAPFDEESQTYLDTRIVHQGDHVAITATHGKYGTCHGETTVPCPTAVTSTCNVTPYGGWTNATYTPDIIRCARTDSVAHVTFSLDLPEGSNYYRLTMDPHIVYQVHNLDNYIGGGDWWTTYEGSDSDTVAWTKSASYIMPTTTRMKLGINSLEGILDDLEVEITDDERFVEHPYEILFTDEYLKNSADQSLLFHVMLSTPCWWWGSEYLYDPTLLPPVEEQDYVIGNPWDYLLPDMECEIRLKLETLTPEYYHYITSSESYENTEYDIFAEPVQIYTNIEGGIGIVASYTVSETILTIPYHFTF